MNKGKKKAVWVVLLQGSSLSLGTYCVGILLTAFLTVRGIIGEAAVFPAVAALCLLSALLGSAAAVRGGLPWDRIPSALLTAVCFSAILLLIGLCGWNACDLMGRGGILLLCALGGGLMAGILTRRRKPRKKRN